MQEKAATVLRPVGFQLPTSLLRSGYIGNITYRGPKGNFSLHISIKERIHSIAVILCSNCISNRLRRLRVYKAMLYDIIESSAYNRTSAGAVKFFRNRNCRISEDL